MLFQIIYFSRFGQFNLEFSSADASLVAVGIISVLFLMYFADKLRSRRGLLFIPFLIALPFAAVGALGGGLLGIAGVLIFGTAPFLIALSIGYWLLKR